jgi:hypothetical protein
VRRHLANSRPQRFSRTLHPRAKFKAPFHTKVWRDLGNSRPEKTPAILNLALAVVWPMAYYTSVPNCIAVEGDLQQKRHRAVRVGHALIASPRDSTRAVGASPAQPGQTLPRLVFFYGPVGRISGAAIAVAGRSRSTPEAISHGHDNPYPARCGAALDKSVASASPIARR